MWDVDLRPSTRLTEKELRKKIYKLEDEIKHLRKQKKIETVLYNITRSENYNSKKINEYKEQVEQLSKENHHLKTRVNNLIRSIYGERVFDNKVSPEADIVFVESITGLNNILKKTRARSYVYARMMLYYILRSRGMTLKGIAKLCRKDHSTIIYALKTYRLDVSIEDQETVNQYLYGNKDSDNGHPETPETLRED